MPRYNIWIREEDNEKWQALENKADWLHFHLNSGYKVVNHNSDGSGNVVNVLDTQMPKNLEEANDPKHPGYSAKVSPDVEFCKHNAVIGFCKKGCR